MSFPQCEEIKTGECVISSLRGFQDFRECHFLNVRKSSFRMCHFLNARKSRLSNVQIFKCKDFKFFDSVISSTRGNQVCRMCHFLIARKLQRNTSRRKTIGSGRSFFFTQKHKKHKKYNTKTNNII